MRKRHDLGGVPGFGPVQREENEPVFHARWEGRTYGMRQALGPSLYRVGGFRNTLENLTDEFYQTRSYYERWLEAVIILAIEKGLIGQDEFDSRMEALLTTPGVDLPAHPDPEKAHQVMSRILRLTPVRREPAEAPRFQPGDAIRVRDFETPSHNRLPAYLLGKRGEIVRNNGGFISNDHAHRDEPVPPPSPLYAVKFTMREVWGDAAEPGEIVADLWEHYLEPATSKEQQ